MYKWKSSVKRNTLAPVYNESFSYEVTEDVKATMDTDNIMISFYVSDYDVLSQNTTAVHIGKHAKSELGRRHWSEVLKSPCQRISFWHPIQLQVAATGKRRHASPLPVPII